MKLDVVTTKGEKKGSVNVSDVSRAAPIAVATVVGAHRANKRTAIANTKDRSEVRGGGRKPWKQKGTGRARHGSSRSPIWIGGGVTFGPISDRNFSKRINKKQRQAVLRTLFTEKAANHHLVILDEITIHEGKTKEVLALLGVLGVDSTALIVIDATCAASDGGKLLLRGARNLSGVRVVAVAQISTYDVLRHDWTVITQNAFEHLMGTEDVKDKKVKKKKENS